MPTYQYACTAPVCGSRFDLVQSFTDPNASECPTCGGAVRKVFSAVGVVFKGAGFYRTDSRAEAGKKASSKSDSSGSDSSKSGSDSSAKPEKSTSKPAAASSDSSTGSSDSSKSSKSSSSSDSSSGRSSNGSSSGSKSSAAAASA